MICDCCKKDFIPHHFNAKLCGVDCKKEARQISRMKYKKTEKGRESEKRYLKSEAGKAKELRYREKPETKILSLKRIRKYATTSVKAKETKKRCDKAYQQTEAGKFSMKNTNHRRRSQKRAGGIKRIEWEELLKKHDGKCVSCGKNNDIQIDHIIPLARGGIHDISNVQPLCGLCNRKKGARLQWQKLV